jgi:Spy/CpxP family protein refolding chaperone
MTQLRIVLLTGLWLCVFGAVVGVRADNSPAAGPSSPTWRHGGGGIQEIYSQMHLTEAQKKQLEDNKNQHRAQMKAIREQMRSCRQVFQQELMKPQLDMNKIHQLHSRLKALESQMADDRLNSILAVRSILTPQQFSEFATLMPKHKHEEHE